MDSGIQFWKSIKRKFIIFSIVLSIVWIILTPFLSIYFKISPLYLSLAILPIVYTMRIVEYVSLFLRDVHDCTERILWFIGSLFFLSFRVEKSTPPSFLQKLAMP
jgi:hypothetical protein